ncbi:transglycosylase domain-containing protein [Lacibacterium aquatile]|uniref:peptidoglycan glycosyltransferase n=1 Tax=Lacibacterium aquatile TaxID=1168082 RepID=A0ABW5DW82_9PROT
MTKSRVLKFIAKWTLVVGIWSTIAVLAVVAFFALQLPPIDDLLAEDRKPGVTLLTRDGKVFANAGDFYGTPFTVSQLQPHTRDAILAIEDRRFYGHFGLDVIGLGRAVFVNLIQGRSAQGGSTITQQVAKNVFLTPEKSLKRKVQEALLALWLERKFTKDQILGIYLNRVYMGAGTYGIDAASQRYFGKPATRLSLYESAVIAGLVQAPTRLNPVRSPEAAATRARIVLRAMVAGDFIDEATAQSAAREELSLNRVAVSRPGRHFADWVAERISTLVSPDQDLVVVTTLDGTLQRRSEDRVEFLLASEGSKRKVSEGAAVILDRSGGILAMVGGRSYASSQFNRTTALRQPGSAFKPLVFLAALERGMSPSSLVLDAPIRIGTWTPENYTRRYHGEVTLADALAESLNTATVRLAQDVGIRNVIALARRLGLSSPLPANLATSLGAGEVSLLELTGAYAMVAAGGGAIEPYGILEIRNRAGVVLWQKPPPIRPEIIVEPSKMAEMDLMLQEVVRRGTGKAALGGGSQVAGKTGTTSDYRDAWFIGYNSENVGGVWLGNDNASPMDKVTGGDLPAKLWSGLMGND